jgi:hypothetical protein
MFTDHDAGHLVGDLAGQVVFEGQARRSGMTLEREWKGKKLCYRFEVGVPGRNEARRVRVEFLPGKRDPSVFADGPYCLRHRWGDDSLCMWTPSDGIQNRWVLADGLPQLVEHIGIHAYCEAECRDGKPWPKEEGPGEHPRKRDCPTCWGRGR